MASCSTEQFHQHLLCGTEHNHSLCEVQSHVTQKQQAPPKSLLVLLKIFQVLFMFISFPLGGFLLWKSVSETLNCLVAMQLLTF
jgi:hypothetical protein